MTLTTSYVLTRDKGDTFPLHFQFFLKPWVSYASFPALLLFGRLPWLATTEPILPCFVIFFLSPSLPSFPHHVHSSSGLCCACSSFLHRPHPVSVPVPVRILSSFVQLRPPSPSISVPVLINVHVPIPAHNSVPVFISAPDSDPAPDPFRSVPSHGRAHPLDAMSVYIIRAMRAELLGARKRHPVCRDDDACRIKVPGRVYISCVVSCGSSPTLCPRWSPSRSRPRSNPRRRSHLCYCSCYCPRSFSCYYSVFFNSSPPPSLSPFPPHPCFGSHPVPAPVPVPILRLFVCLHLVLVPAPVLSPSPLTPRFSPPTPFPSPFPPPIPILLPTRYAPSRLSDPVTLSVRCACTKPGLCV